MKATHVISKVYGGYDPELYDVGDEIWQSPEQENNYTSNKMQAVFRNDTGLSARSRWEIVTVEIWNSPLCKALR